jgi:hypothetical protein
MNAIGRFTVAETCNPNGVKLPVTVAIGVGVSFFRFIFIIPVFILPVIMNFRGNRCGRKSYF